MRRWWIGGVLAAIIVLAIIIIVGNSPSSSTTSQTQSGKSTVPTRPSTLSLRGDYFSITYPGTYGSDDTSKTDPTAFEQHRLIGNETYQKTLGIVISPLPNGLGEESSYKLRTSNPARYHDRTIGTPSGTVHIMSTDDSKEEVAYVVKNSMVAIIALTTNGPRDNLDKETEQLAKSFAWTR